MSRIQTCWSCKETFTGTAAGDAHRITVGTYDLASHGGELIRLAPVRDEKGKPVLPAGYKLKSQGNVIRRCMSADEMKAGGMRKNRHGQWSLGGESPWVVTHA